ncbi:Uncharacterized protein APZ42_023249 [Daphnia magna]|uniref:Uncharacterized protein n=1 Tax=Daphnia magna TaxID=35525 RepID=A0A0P5YIP9_9CRUS|nr:Uncharacterized protein APZ42_023249 [Daphnia magna]
MEQGSKERGHLPATIQRMPSYLHQVWRWPFLLHPFYFIAPHTHSHEKSSEKMERIKELASSIKPEAAKRFPSRGKGATSAL